MNTTPRIMSIRYGIGAAAIGIVATGAFTVVAPDATSTLASASTSQADPSVIVGSVQTGLLPGRSADRDGASNAS